MFVLFLSGISEYISVCEFFRKNIRLFVVDFSFYVEFIFGTANDFIFDPVGFSVFFQLEFYLGFAVFFLYFKFGFLNFFAALVNFALIFGFVFTFFVFRFVSEYDEIRFAFFHGKFEFEFFLVSLGLLFSLSRSFERVFADNQNTDKRCGSFSRILVSRQAHAPVPK